MQVAGTGKPPLGTLTKSWQTHIFWQQNGPAVVGQAQTKPFLHVVPGSESLQSSSVLQNAVHIASSGVAPSGWMQTRLGHWRLGEEMMETPLPDPASAGALVLQARPMC
jgi:hypothetical protein